MNDRTGPNSKTQDNGANGKNGKPEPNRAGMVLVIVALVVVALVVAALIFFLTDPERTANIRDVVIIALALVSVVVSAASAVLVFQLTSVVSLLKQEVEPMLVNANRTVNTLRATTDLVSDNVAEPVIRAAGAVAGIRKAARLIRQGGRR